MYSRLSSHPLEERLFITLRFLKASKAVVLSASVVLLQLFQTSGVPDSQVETFSSNSFHRTIAKSK